HGEQWHRQEQDEAQVDEQQLEEVLEDVLAEAEGDEEHQIGVEVVAGEEEKDRPHGVEERLGEEAVEFFAQQCSEPPRGERETAHASRSSSSSTNMSSRVRLRGPSSKIGSPASTQRRARSDVTRSRERCVSASVAP